MPNEVFQTRLADDVAAAVHEFKDERGIAKSEATRRLVAAGLDARDEPPQNGEQVHDAEQDDQSDYPRPRAEKVAIGLAVLALGAWTLAEWFWATSGGMADPWGAFLAPETLTFIGLTVVYGLFAAAAHAIARGALDRPDPPEAADDGGDPA